MPPAVIAAAAVLVIIKSIRQTIATAAKTRTRCFLLGGADGLRRKSPGVCYRRVRVLCNSHLLQDPLAVHAEPAVRRFCEAQASPLENGSLFAVFSFVGMPRAAAAE
jgi:methionine aminopeptidase